MTTLTYTAVMKKFLQQLRDRGVIKVGLAYLVGAWLVLQLADVIFPALNLPDVAITLVLGIMVVGFPLALILSWAFDMTPDGIVRTPDQTPADEVNQDSAPTADESLSIAVLPFSDMSADKDQEHFCDGLTEELLNVLTRIPGLQVSSRTSSFSFKGKSIDIPEIANRLHVGNILEGSVRKSGTRLRITAQLIHVASDSHLWSETYDRELEDIFVIQDDIARQILKGLEYRLGGAPSLVPTTKDPKAYEYFLRGLGYALVAGQRDMELAVEMFQKAVEHDPAFLRAWIRLSEQCAMLAQFYSRDQKWPDVASSAAAKALELSPDGADSALAAAYALIANQRYDEAEKELRKVIEVDPMNARAFHHLGRTLFQRGDIAGALDNFDRATALDPDDFESPLIATSAYESQGELANARRVAAIGVERAEKVLQDYPDNQRAYYLGASGLTLMGQDERALEWAERALEISPNDPGTTYNSACFFARLNEQERALDCLEQSIVSRNWIESDPDLDNLRDHPRYLAFLEGLPE
jgi:adenylate cyclase